MVLTQHVPRLPGAGVGLFLAISGCFVTPTGTTAPAEPTADEVTKHALAEQQLRRARLQTAANLCKSGDDSGCAQLLSDEAMWRQATASPSNARSVELLRRACDGGLESACAVSAATAPTGIIAPTAPTPSQSATFRVLDILGQLETLSNRWIAQLDVLSKTRCASGTEEQIAGEWQGGAEKRAAELTRLDDAMAAALVATAEASFAGTWSFRRDYVDLRVRVALERGMRCEEHIDDASEVGLGILLDADKKPARDPGDPVAPASQPSSACCKRCQRNSKPCGDSCISVSKTCHKDVGCAC